MKRNDEFVQGVAYAVAELIRTHDQPTMGRDILNNSGIAREEFERHAADYDLNEIRQILPRRKRRSRAEVIKGMMAGVVRQPVSAGDRHE